MPALIPMFVFLAPLPLLCSVLYPLPLFVCLSRNLNEDHGVESFKLAAS